MELQLKWRSRRQRRFGGRGGNGGNGMANGGMPVVQTNPTRTGAHNAGGSAVLAENGDDRGAGGSGGAGGQLPSATAMESGIPVRAGTGGAGGAGTDWRRRRRGRGSDFMLDIDGVKLRRFVGGPAPPGWGQGGRRIGIWRNATGTARLYLVQAVRYYASGGNGGKPAAHPSAVMAVLAGGRLRQCNWEGPAGGPPVGPLARAVPGGSGGSRSPATALRRRAATRSIVSDDHHSRRRRRRGRPGANGGAAAPAATNLIDRPPRYGRRRRRYCDERLRRSWWAVSGWLEPRKAARSMVLGRRRVWTDRRFWRSGGWGKWRVQHCAEPGGVGSRRQLEQWDRRAGGAGGNGAAAPTPSRNWRHWRNAVSGGSRRHTLMAPPEALGVCNDRRDALDSHNSRCQNPRSRERAVLA